MSGTIQPRTTPTQGGALLPLPIDSTWSSPSIRLWQRVFPREPLPQPVITPLQAREKWEMFLRDLLTQHELALKCAYTVEAEARIIKELHDRGLRELFNAHISQELEW